MINPRLALVMTECLLKIIVRTRPNFIEYARSNDDVLIETWIVGMRTTADILEKTWNHGMTVEQLANKMQEALAFHRQDVDMRGR